MVRGDQVEHRKRDDREGGEKQKQAPSDATFGPVESFHLEDWPPRRCCWKSSSSSVATRAIHLIHRVYDAPSGRLDSMVFDVDDEFGSGVNLHLN